VADADTAHHDRHTVRGKLYVWVKGIRDIPAMDADFGNKVVENRAHGLGTIWPLTQLLPVAWSHLLKGVL
jgi:hypothetical protein